jgi:hypothetical protein
MTRDDIIRMAREAGIDVWWDSGNEHRERLQEHLEHFAALIEKHLSYDGIHTCHDQCQRPACVATRNAVEREREACAQVCDAHTVDDVLVGVGIGQSCADAIRARSEK